MDGITLAYEILICTQCYHDCDITEVWTLIDWVQPHIYYVSSYGCVGMYSEQKRSGHRSYPHLMSPTKAGKRGYYRIRLSNKWYSVSRLVATAFLENPLNKPTVEHKNHLRWDNHVTNLEWFTHSEQQLSRHAFQRLKKQSSGR